MKLIRKFLFSFVSLASARMLQFDQVKSLFLGFPFNASVCLHHSAAVLINPGDKRLSFNAIER